MSAKPDGGPAFPLSGEEDADGDVLRYAVPGMTLRDYFAAQALTGMAATAVGLGELAPEERARIIAGCAEILYEMADAMIAERDK